MSVPKLRFKEFDGDWNKNTIGNFVLNYKGGASLTPADFVEYSDCEVIPKKAISSGGLLQLDKVVPTFCTLEFFNSNQNYIVDSEYLITTLRDLVPSGPSIGYIVKYESNKKYILAQGVYGFRIKNDLNRDFLIQFSNTSKFRLHMQSIMVGSTQVHIRNQDYFSTELYTPSLIEQTKIASFLSAVDEKISQLTQKHELLSQYKQGMMQKLFSQQIRFKADDGSEFGEWEEVALSKVSDVRDGTHDSPSYVKDGYPLITSKNLKNGKLDLTDINLISEDDYLNINKRSAVNIGDIIFGMIGTIGNPVLLNSDGFAIKNVALIKEKDELLNIYLIHYLNSSFFAKQVALLNAGNTQKFLALGQIRSLSIHKPQLAEQTKIANFLSSIDQKIEVVAQQIEQAKQWKKGLLQQMFV
ncbi:TPA: restriction endonuclease subunit S [Acinetobacter baumannii]|uniref:restriction endonuclease subunit S n=2 Tax=Acinetobacter baumannii TaxID=470 RepID=UPI001CDC3FF5|nr:restriction endonuclease subunit S [Acinetobacter baumannii]MCA4260292.1 restriction endonuclease subunit S [Acinetobacter baumannii]MDV4249768.1 restriction endonuclease subunit S [Acinetobacter baumannii]MDV4288967.1 restriction endonuclease subunit S [Acinetobacter baumannii]HAV4244779.1 restriction endonuclease subunit S [Acinetobacter baumannii]